MNCPLPKFDKFKCNFSPAPKNLGSSLASLISLIKLGRQAANLHETLAKKDLMHQCEVRKFIYWKLTDVEKRQVQEN